jgi:eukaryotic-like serine/threonine-protein kinase
MEADWVGSSPVVSAKHNLLYVGEEFGLWKKRGGIVAIDLDTGKKKWDYREMEDFVHSSPLLIGKESQVVIGSNSGFVYCFDAAKGDLVWSFKVPSELGLEIRGSFAYDEKRQLISFGAFDSGLYILDARTGTLINSIKVEHPIYGTPLFYQGLVFFASLDKNIYCFKVDDLKLQWKFETNGRIFASPTIINDLLYIGSNDGRLYELDPHTGKNTSFLQLTERITNQVVYNQSTDRYFILTYANEIYCIERTKN